MLISQKPNNIGLKSMKLESIVVHLPRIGPSFRQTLQQGVCDLLFENASGSAKLNVGAQLQHWHSNGWWDSSHFGSSTRLARFCQEQPTSRDAKVSVIHSIENIEGGAGLCHCTTSKRTPLRTDHGMST